MEKSKISRLTKNQEINLYWVKIPNQAKAIEIQHKLNYLDKGEQKIYDSYKVEEKKVEFLLGRVLIKNLLSVWLEQEPEKIKFIKNVYGKPYLHPSYERTDLYFNLSHAKGVLACVVSPWEKVGIDIEFTDIDAFEVMNSVFVKKEIDYVNKQLTSTLKRQAFFKIWTRKEAVMKAEGKGFSLPSKSFSVPVEGERGTDGKYKYMTYSFLPNSICSLVVKNRDFKCYIQNFDYEDILGLN